MSRACTKEFLRHAWLRGRGQRACAIEKETAMRTISSVLVCALTAAWAGGASAQEIDWKKVDEALGRTAAVSGDVHRYGFPRTDLQVTLDGVTIKPTLALGGWVAFKPMHGGAMVMGDLVLLETEVNPVMTKLIESGLEITAVHNHLLRAHPLTFYMHVGGHGDPVKLATAIRAALAESKTPLGRRPRGRPPPAIDLDTAQLDQIIGVKGQANGGVYQFACRGAIRSPRAECRSRRPARWASRPPSTSSRPAAARPRSPATSC